ncbi:unnamed protein product [Closterium sp. Naga37s-1]|nr:unnamed protein product [Closterium sp. Naga37s-1]
MLFFYIRPLLFCSVLSHYSTPCQPLSLPSSAHSHVLKQQQEEYEAEDIDWFDSPSFPHRNPPFPEESTSSYPSTSPTIPQHLPSLLPTAACAEAAAGHVLKQQQEEYEAEGIDWSRIDFVDNQDVLELVEGVSE